LAAAGAAAGTKHTLAALSPNPPCSCLFVANVMAAAA
jgi:hypothetical protein